MGETGSTASFCGQCGAAIPAGNKFCTGCGTPSGVHAAVTPAMAAAALAGADAASADAVSGSPPNGHSTLDEDEAGAVAPPAAAHIDGLTTDVHASAPDAERAGPTPSAPTTSPPRAPSPGPRPRGKARWALIGGSAAAIAVVVVVLVIVLTGGGGDKSGSQAATGPTPAVIYQQQVAKVFGPVLGANQAISQRLTSISGTKPDSARLAVRQAQQATTAATGALGALTVPSNQGKLAGDAQQVIDREVAYLAAVSAVLNHPTVAGASQLQTLSSNLTSALDAAGPTIAGDQPTVSGADRLTAWARTTSRKLARLAAQKRAKALRQRASGGGSSSSGNSGSATASAPHGTSCGGGVYAGPSTSCSFALNVRDAYEQAPGATASVRVYSPVTDQYYTMDCHPSGSGVTCSGGNNASVTF